MLVSTRAAIQLVLFRFRRFLCCCFCQRDKREPRKRRKICRLSWLSIFQLPWGRRRKAQPIYYVVAERLSRESVRHFTRCALGPNRRRGRHCPSAIKCTLHSLPLAIPIGRANAARADRASRRRSFLRKLSRRSRALAARTHAH